MISLRGSCYFLLRFIPLFPMRLLALHTQILYIRSTIWYTLLKNMSRVECSYGPEHALDLFILLLTRNSPPCYSVSPSVYWAFRSTFKVSRREDCRVRTSLCSAGPMSFPVYNNNNNTSFWEVGVCMLFLSSVLWVGPVGCGFHEVQRKTSRAKM